MSSADPDESSPTTQETQSWGYGTLTPIAPLSFSLKIGNGLRKASTFDPAVLPFQENPSVRDYDYAPRDGGSRSVINSVLPATLGVDEGAPPYRQKTPG